MTTAQPPATIVVDDHDRYAAAGARLGAGAYHAPGWRVVFDLYGLASHWLVAVRGDQPVGILPLVRQSSALFGRRLISLPWVDEAGAIGDASAVDALLDHAARLAERQGAGFAAIVKQPASAGAEGPGWKIDHGDKVLMRLPLDVAVDELWSKLSAKVRNQVRKAEKSGLSTERGGAELIEGFYEVYSSNMRDLGSPSHSRAFFETLVDALGERAAVYCTRLDGAVVGAGLVLDNGASLDIPWASSRREHNRLCVNHGMYWRVLADACEAGGHAWFHFGRSSVGSGQHKFKKQWGAEETPLAWLRREQAAHADVAANATEVREKFGLAQRAWTRLPLWVSRRLGPRIIRHAP